MSLCSACDVSGCERNMRYICIFMRHQSNAYANTDHNVLIYDIHISNTINVFGRINTSKGRPDTIPPFGASSVCRRILKRLMRSVKNRISGVRNKDTCKVLGACSLRSVILFGDPLVIVVVAVGTRNWMCTVRPTAKGYHAKTTIIPMWLDDFDGAGGFVAARLAKKKTQTFLTQTITNTICGNHSKDQSGITDFTRLLGLHSNIQYIYLGHAIESAKLSSVLCLTGAQIFWFSNYIDTDVTHSVTHFVRATQPHTANGKSS